MMSEKLIESFVRGVLSEADIDWDADDRLIAKTKPHLRSFDLIVHVASNDLVFSRGEYNYVSLCGDVTGVQDAYHRQMNLMPDNITRDPKHATCLKCRDLAQAGMTP
jgi:hypothetical protein